MSLREKYWFTILLVFGRYISILMMIAPFAFAIVGRYVDKFWYLGLLVWPLMIMWALVNLRYIRLIFRIKRLEWTDILEDEEDDD